MAGLRTIRESANATAELDRLTQKYPRFRDWWERGWSWRLVRDPFEDATPIPETDPKTYLLKTTSHHAAWGFPFTLTFMYTVGENVIDLIEIRFVEIISE